MKDLNKPQDKMNQKRKLPTEASQETSDIIKPFDHKAFLKSPELRKAIIDHLQKTGQIKPDKPDDKK